MSKIVFRCDMDRASGFGHFYRCVDLARNIKILRPGVGISFLGRYESLAITLLEREAFSWITLREEIGFGLRSTLEYSRSQDILFIDTYQISNSDISQLKTQSIKHGTKLAFFDDFGTLDFNDVNLVINFRVEAESLYRYASKKEAKGTRYYPSSPSLKNTREKRLGSFTPELKKVLIFVGGVDLHNVSARLLQASERAFDSAEIRFVLPQTSKIKVLIKPGRAGTKILSSVPDLSILLADSDLVICGGGKLKYDAAFACIPSACLSQSEGQDQDTVLLEKAGLTHNLGMAAGARPDSLYEKLLALRSDSFREKQFQVGKEKFFSDSAENAANIVVNI
jgi:spore coat polysaccharide biosynthesis predicted glycosyltransferase SpsG